MRAQPNFECQKKPFMPSKLIKWEIKGRVIRLCLLLSGHWISIYRSIRLSQNMKNDGQGLEPLLSTSHFSNEVSFIFNISSCYNCINQQIVDTANPRDKILIRDYLFESSLPQLLGSSFLVQSGLLGFEVYTQNKGIRWDCESTSNSKSGRKRLSSTPEQPWPCW